jgi:hypothetical protein
VTPAQKRIFLSLWWKANVPAGWTVEQDESCATFTQESGVGALQISCVRKKDGQATEKDIQSAAEDWPHAEFSWEWMQLGSLAGLYRERIDNDIFWMEWFLSKEALLFLITYNCDHEKRYDEVNDVHKIISSIDCRL